MEAHCSGSLIPHLRMSVKGVSFEELQTIQSCLTLLQAFSVHCWSIVAITAHHISNKSKNPLLGEMAERELRYASDVGCDYCKHKYAQKSLTWNFHGGNNNNNKVFFQPDVSIRVRNRKFIVKFFQIFSKEAFQKSYFRVVLTIF